MSIVGELYNFWGVGLIFLFRRMMYDKRYLYWLRYFQIPIERTAKEVKLVGYTKKKLTKFWEISSKLQSVVLWITFYNGIIVMSISAISYVIIMHQRYSGKLHSPLVFWTILLVSFLSIFSRKNKPQHDVLAHRETMLPWCSMVQ